VVGKNDRSAGELRELFENIISKIGEFGKKVEQFINSIKEKIENKESPRKIRRNR
jgi:hypothetical protein